MKIAVKKKILISKIMGLLSQGYGAKGENTFAYYNAKTALEKLSYSELDSLWLLILISAK